LTVRGFRLLWAYILRSAARKIGGTTRAPKDATRTKALVSTTGLRRAIAESVYCAISSAVCFEEPGGRTPGVVSFEIEFEWNGVSTGPGRTTATAIPAGATSARSAIAS